MPIPTRTARPPIEKGPPRRNAASSPRTLRNCSTRYLTVTGNDLHVATADTVLVLREDENLEASVVSSPTSESLASFRLELLSSCCCPWAIAVDRQRARASAHAIAAAVLSSSRFLKQIWIASSKLAVGSVLSPPRIGRTNSGASAAQKCAAP